MLKAFYQALKRGDEAFWRKELGDYVNLFWPILVPWSSMLWDPKRYPMMTYQANKDDGPSAFKDEAWVRTTFPWHMRLLMKLFMPKTMSRVKDAKKGFKTVEDQFKQERSGIVEYLEDASRTDEHYFRVYDNFECWGLKNIGTTIASYIPPIITGGCKGFESFQGLERDWNAIETKCVGLGDPYCEFKMVPGEIDDLEHSLVKDVSVIERIHNRLMDRLMGFMLESKPLIEKRTRLGKRCPPSRRQPYHGRREHSCPGKGVEREVSDGGQDGRRKDRKGGWRTSSGGGLNRGRGCESSSPLLRTLQGRNRDDK